MGNPNPIALVPDLSLVAGKGMILKHAVDNKVVACTCRFLFSESHVIYSVFFYFRNHMYLVIDGTCLTFLFVYLVTEFYPFNKNKYRLQ